MKRPWGGFQAEVHFVRQVPNCPPDFLRAEANEWLPSLRCAPLPTRTLYEYVELSAKHTLRTTPHFP
jgi:hypothetical protein